MILIRLLLEKQLNYDRKAQDDTPALLVIYEQRVYPITLSSNDYPLKRTFSGYELNCFSYLSNI